MHIFFNFSKKIFWNIIGVIAILVGIFALITPFTPGSWLVLVGLFIIFGRERTEKWIERVFGVRWMRKLKDTKLFKKLNRD